MENGIENWRKKNVARLLKFLKNENPAPPPPIPSSCPTSYSTYTALKAETPEEGVFGDGVADGVEEVLNWHWMIKHISTGLLPRGCQL